MPTLVFIPGLLSDDVVWQPVADALSERYQVVIADSSAGVSLSDMAAVMLAQYPGKLIPVGHSMGGRIALEMFRLAPGRIAGLGLIDTGAHGIEAGEQQKRQRWVDLANAEGIEAFLDVWLPPMVHPARHQDEVMGVLKAMVRRATPAQLERQIQGLVNRLDASGLLPQIEVPVLLVTGRQDEWSNVAQHEAMAAEVRDATLVVIEDAGHFAPIEKPEAMAGALRDWLERKLPAV